MTTETSPTEMAASPQASLFDRLRSGAVAFWLLAFAVQVPLLTFYLVWIWRFEHYRYFPFLLLSVGWLSWSRLSTPICYPTKKLPLTLIVSSLFVLLAGSVLNSPWFSSISFVLLAASFLSAHKQLYLSVPLLLLIRLPMGFDLQVITYLQTATTRLSSYILDLLFVPHLARGNVLELADRELFVAEACSGVQSAFTIAFVALFIAAWRQRAIALIPVYVVLALAWAALCNTVRVTTIAYAAVRLQIDLSAGVAHEILGYSTLILAALLTLSTDSLLALVFHSVGGEPESGFNPFVSVWEWLFDSSVDQTTLDHSLAGTTGDEPSAWQSFFFGPRRLALVAVAVAGLVSFLPLIAYSMASRQVINPEGNVLTNLSPALLDGIPGAVTYQFVETVRNGTDPQLGKNADIWSLRLRDLSGTLVISQPYPEWHDLNMCYKAQGWRFMQGCLLQPSDLQSARSKIPYSIHTRQDSAMGHLFMACVKADGLVVPPPASNVLERLVEKYRSPATYVDSNRMFTGDVAMLQIWTVTDRELDSETVAELASSLTHVRDRFAAALVKAEPEFDAP